MKLLIVHFFVSDPDWTPSETIIKTIAEKNEPSIEVIPGTAMIFQISLTSVCNYSTYEHSDFCIKFNNTLIFEARTIRISEDSFSYLLFSF